MRVPGERSLVAQRWCLPSFEDRASDLSQWRSGLRYADVRRARTRSPVGGVVIASASYQLEAGVRGRWSRSIAAQRRGLAHVAHGRRKIRLGPALAQRNGLGSRKTSCCASTPWRLRSTGSSHCRTRLGRLRHCGGSVQAELLADRIDDSELSGIEVQTELVRQPVLIAFQITIAQSSSAWIGL